MLLGKRICVGWNRLLLLLLVVILITRLLSVKELHQQRDFQDVPKEKPKPVPLIQGPAAGEGLSDRLQCQGTRALNTTQFGSIPKNCLSIVTFVTVFTIYNSTADSRPTELVTVGNMSYNKVERSMAILNVFLKFVQLTSITRVSPKPWGCDSSIALYKPLEAMYGCHVVILTDPTSDLPLPRDRLTIQPIKGEYSRDKLMLQRIKSYIIFLQTRLEKLKQDQEPETHFIFTDSDIAVIGDLDDIFSDYRDFDLALTFRNNKDQPLNSGFIAVRGTADGIQRGMAFLQEVLEVYSSKFMRASRMLGDQLALAWVVKSEPNFNMKRFSRREAFQYMIGGASVLFLPCSLYNWTPPEGAGQFRGRNAFGCEGSRKRLMLEAWNYYLSSRHNLPDMLCLILRSGRAKYDFRTLCFDELMLHQVLHSLSQETMFLQSSLTGVVVGFKKLVSATTQHEIIRGQEEIHVRQHVSLLWH
ncbi:hypothetical protein SASPL_103937 [Salvia splendens]|uniref:Nucleotide-diphospho-sugar transferase domain-containing protein n=1 Tax=Salvia splendens TaxID=180675 RepID=A0A8X8YLW2_SALSN|nr:hypothetical protein SASPL_103937 [Salvia splendens]